MSYEDRTPPQSVEAEYSVLGALLIQSDYGLPLVISDLKPDDFYRHTHAEIYRACLDVHKAGDAVDLVTVSTRLRDVGSLDDIGGYSYLMDLAASIPTAANIRYYAKIVKEKSMLRKAIRAGMEIVEGAYDCDGPIADFIDGAEQRVLALGQGLNDSTKGGPVPIANVLSSVYETVENRYRNQDHVVGAPTGYTDLDYMTSGLHSSDLLILAARPAMGKTAFALNLAENVAQATMNPVIVFSLEMSKEQLVQRILCSEARVDSHRLKTGYLSDSDWPKISEAMGKLASLPIHIDDTPAVTVNYVRNRSRTIKSQSKRPLGLIVVDYLQLMSGGNESNGRGENRVQEVSAISRNLKALARELDVPVIALSQLSRGVESRTDKRPMLSDLRESGSLEQDADIVMFIYRDEYYNPDTLDKNIAEVILAKHRNGPVGKVKLFFENQQTRFENLAPEITPVF